jgi:diguanylate cyclase (GGDEF)-like protein
MSGLNILIVDDSVGGNQLRDVLRATDSTYQVVVANSAKVARDHLMAGYFDCVFLNTRIGDCNGISLLPAIDAHRGRLATATIMTGAGDEREIVEAMRNGAADFLSKARLSADTVRRAIEIGLASARQAQDQRDVRARLNHLAMFDGRTGLPSRPLFCDRLNHAVVAARRNRQNLAVMVLDLDVFRSVNERFGRQAGDAVLAEVGARVRAVMRGSDTLARLHSDEFATLLPGVDSSDAAVVVAEKIISAVGAPISVGRDQVALGVSIGIAMYPFDGLGPEALFDNADAAMYQAKRRQVGYAFHADMARQAKTQPSALRAADGI